jgi:hypothetical protein
MDKNDCNRGLTVGRINFKMWRLISPPTPTTAWNLPHVTILELGILNYFEMAPRILESLWTAGYILFLVAKFVFLMYMQ